MYVSKYKQEHTYMFQKIYIFFKEYIFKIQKWPNATIAFFKVLKQHKFLQNYKISTLK